MVANGTMHFCRESESRRFHRPGNPSSTRLPEREVVEPPSIAVNISWVEWSVGGRSTSFDPGRIV